MIAKRLVVSAIPFLFAASCSCALAQQVFDDNAAMRAERHQSVDWLTMEGHLPSLETGPAAQLQVAADVLRARRMPEDALEYYQAAVRRGGDEAVLMNRIGITYLELHEPVPAKLSFHRALLLKSKDAESWNNLGAAEYVSGNYTAAIQDYQRAVKLNKKKAVFHSNLGTAYFEVKDYESALVQFQAAIKLDRNIFSMGGVGGVEAHVMSPADRGRFCFEMARLAAKNHDDESVLSWLAKASETGYDVHFEMTQEKSLSPYAKDARVMMILKNSKAMQRGQIAANGPAPALPADKR